MSEIRINIADNGDVISGELHRSFIDALLASLMAEPETIDEFRVALTRFVKPTETWTPLGSFRRSENLEPYDAGILAIDLAARVIGIDSTYSSATMEGRVKVDAEFSDFAEVDGCVYIPYRLPQDWRIIHGIPGFEGAVSVSRRERADVKQVDLRHVLYGEPLIDFVIEHLSLSPDLETEDLYQKIHAEWLMTTRDDLLGKSPREVLFEKRQTIDFDLYTRELQYSFTKLCPKPIPPESFGYRNAGFGSHEIIVYYEFVRDIISHVLTGFEQERSMPFEQRRQRLKEFADLWWISTNAEFSRKPGEVIEAERKRLNLTLSAQECLVDDDCPCCIAMYEDFDTPVFWHLDGCNMDDQFEFSLYETRDEWEAEQERYRQMDAEFAARKYIDSGTDDVIVDDEPPF